MAQTIIFQRDGGWWHCWEPAAPVDRNHQDAYLVADDMSDADEPRAAIYADVFARWCDGNPCDVVIAPPNAKIDEDGYPVAGTTSTMRVAGTIGKDGHRTENCAICGATRCECPDAMRVARG